MNFSFQLVCSTQIKCTTKVVFGGIFGTAYFRISGASGASPLGPTEGLTLSPDPLLLQAMTYGHCISCLGQDTTFIHPSRQIWPTTLNSFKNACIHCGAPQRDVLSDKMVLWVVTSSFYFILTSLFCYLCYKLCIQNKWWWLIFFYFMLCQSSLLDTVMCMIKTFRGEGVVDGEGGSSERCLKWGCGGGVIKGSFQKHLKTGGG